MATPHLIPAETFLPLCKNQRSILRLMGCALGSRGFGVGSTFGLCLVPRRDLDAGKICQVPALPCRGLEPMAVP